MMGEIPALVCGVVRTITGDALGHRLGGGGVTLSEGCGKDKSFNFAFLSSIVSYSPHDVLREGGIVVGLGYCCCFKSLR